jgi:SAM-dependent methyltransferase
MGHECLKASKRRVLDPAFRERYFVGTGIDVGAGGDGLSRQRDLFPNITDVRDWDMADGDGMLLESVPDESVDFVHSSHCLEHLVDPQQSLKNWLRVVRPGGYVVALMPDEDMYEQGLFPSTYNPDHKRTFTPWKARSWSQWSVNVIELIPPLGAACELVKLESLHFTHDWESSRRDQTGGDSESAIELILRKRRAWEVDLGGRLRLQ